MLLCLSSGATERYRQDVLRTLALPQGATLTFRYAEHLVEGHLWSRAGSSADGLVGESALVAFLDEASSGPDLGEQRVIPLRCATIISSRAVGTTLQLEFLLLEWGHSADLPAVFETCKQALRLSAGHSGRPFKFYCAEVGDLGLRRDASFATWERILEQLHSRPGFSNEVVFLNIAAIRPFEVASDASSTVGTLPAALAANRDHEVLIYHWRPGEADVDPRKVLKLELGPDLMHITPDSLVVDSAYDLKRFVVRQSRPAIGTTRTWMTVRLATLDDSVIADLELPVAVSIKRSLRGPLLTVGGIALGLFVPQVAVIAASDGPDGSGKALLAILALVSSCLVGLSAALGLRTHL